MFSNGSRQMRQSEGKKTEKRLSAELRTDRYKGLGEASRKTIEGPATATMA